MMFRGTVEEEYGGMFVWLWRGELKGGRPVEDGDTTDPWGLVGEWNPDCGKLPGGDPTPHLSTCSGLMLMGLGGSWVLPSGGFCSWGGGVAAMVGGIFSTGVEVVSEAQDCGELAVVEPGDEAVACVESGPFSLEPDAFSAFRHLALRFWNQTWTLASVRLIFMASSSLMNTSG